MLKIGNLILIKYNLTAMEQLIKGGNKLMYNPEKEYQLILSRLKLICSQKNLTTYSLSKVTGISTSSLSNLMNGKTKPYIYTLLIICNALEISLSDLLEHKDSDREDECQIISIYHSLPPEKKKLFKIYLDMLVQYTEDLKK